ncbi:MAG: hypothetical protein GYB66_09465 [Chloroflexi bacterium]|nr:hypothetical protein [Chloroflexota bacterium]
MRESKAIIERTRRIGPNWQHLALAVEDTALAQIAPGQSLLVRATDSRDPYLRENWVPVGFDPEVNVLQIEHPINRHYGAGDAVSVIGPIGLGFEIMPGANHLLLIAQDYPPTRLIFLMMQAIENGLAVTLVLTGIASRYPIAALPPVVEVVHSEEIVAWPGNKEMLQWAHQVFVITSPVFAEERYRAVQELARDARQALPDRFLSGIFDLTIPCGTGACQACMVRTRQNDGLVCLSGPAFDLAKLKRS